MPQKFSKSLVKPKIALPIATSFNEIVTLDLKQFGDKYVLWCIDLFTRFIQGRLLKNKKAETVLNGINERNHASCDLTIKKLMEDKKIGLTDTLVKTAAWTHNTNVNKTGFSPLTQVTGKT